MRTTEIKMTDSDKWAAAKIRRIARQEYGWARVRILGRFHFEVETGLGRQVIRILPPKGS